MGSWTRWSVLVPDGPTRINSTAEIGDLDVGITSNLVISAADVAGDAFEGLIADPLELGFSMSLKLQNLWIRIVTDLLVDEASLDKLNPDQYDLSCLLNSVSLIDVAQMLTTMQINQTQFSFGSGSLAHGLERIANSLVSLFTGPFSRTLPPLISFLLNNRLRNSANSMLNTSVADAKCPAADDHSPLASKVATTNVVIFVSAGLLLLAAAMGLWCCHRRNSRNAEVAAHCDTTLAGQQLI